MASKIKQYSVTVTQRNIDNGYTHSCKRCPIALALRRVFHTTKVDVDAFYITINSKIFVTPQIAIDFMIDYDKRRNVRPITFHLTEAING
jgi:hypothetical protein